MKIEVYTKQGCPFCVKAKDWLDVEGLDYTVHDLSDDTERRAFYAQWNVNSVPQVFIDGKRIGGYTDLVRVGRDAIVQTQTCLDPSRTYKPFRYPEFVEMARTHEKMHWVEDEIDLSEDVADWKGNKLSQAEKDFIRKVLTLFTQSDAEVSDIYIDHFLPKFKNNEVRQMLVSFAARESIHQRAYALLNDTLGFPDSFYSEFVQYSEMADKIDHMSAMDTSTQRGTALALARAVFNEGVMLFASFAMLLNFTRFNKMKGMGKVVDWSIKDEDCFSDDTEVLTENGWKLFKDVLESEQIAQWDQCTGEIDYAYPTHRIEKPFSGEMINFKMTNTDTLVTPTHDMIIYNDFKDEWSKVAAENIRPSSRIWFPVAGNSSVSGAGLSPHEKFLIALQADGSIRKGIDDVGKFSGTCQTSFCLTKMRKQDRPKGICTDAGYNMSDAYERDGKSSYRVMVPIDNRVTKSFRDWVGKLSERSLVWKREFVEEVVQWDGHVTETGLKIYCSTNKENIDIAQAIAIEAGYKTQIIESEDDRKDSYKTYYRLSMKDGMTRVRTGVLRNNITRIPYDGMVYCFTMPKGTLVTRRNGKVHIAGNCHAKGLARLFRILCEEKPRIVNDEFKKEIYEMARQTVALEDAFIDLAFRNNEGAIQGLTADEVRTYIRYITDQRLVSLGLKENYGVENPLDWIDWVIGGTRHSNFFENKVSGYSVGGLSGEFSYDFIDV